VASLFVAAVLVALVWGLGACRSGPRAQASAQASLADYEAGVVAFRAGRFAEAITLLGRYLRSADPDGDASAEIEAAHLFTVQAHAGLGDCAAAETALAALVRRHPRSNLLGEARVAVRACVPDQPPKPLGPAEAEAGLRAALAAGDAARTVAFACAASELGVALDEPTRAAVQDAVDELGAAELEPALVRCAPLAWPAPLVAYRHVAILVHQGELARARSALDAIADDDLRAQASKLVAAAESAAQVDPSIIAVLLPLSGPRQKLGAEARLAIETVAAGRAGVKLVFADTQGDERRAADVVDEVVARDHPIAILGPLGEREASAAAARAAAWGVPIAVLSPLRGVEDPQVGVFRLWTTAEERARLAARVAIDRGFEAPAVLLPRDEGARREAAAFSDEARRLGHEVAAIGEYDPTATDLEPDVLAFLGLDPRQNERLRAHLAKDPKNGWKTFSPDVGFDLLYLPDGYAQAALIAAFLVYFNVELRTAETMSSLELARKHGGRPPSFVQLLGGAGWNHPDLGLRGGAAVEWALVVDLFFPAEPQSDAAAALIEAFQARLGRPPSALAAQAADGAGLVLAAQAQVLAAASPSRQGFSRALESGAAIEGACGPARVGPSGAIERGGLLLRVDGGQLGVVEPIEPAWVSP
jgi:ABC-type branched-subunit amino acid transport system substrate-binding protein